jgi:hypothetical protein
MRVIAPIKTWAGIFREYRKGERRLVIALRAIYAEEVLEKSRYVSWV